MHMPITSGIPHARNSHGLQTALAWAVGAPRGGLDRGDFGSAFFSSSHRMWKRMFSSPNIKCYLNPSFIVSSTPLPPSCLLQLFLEGNSEKAQTAQSAGKYTLFMEWNRLRIWIVHFASICVIILKEHCKCYYLRFLQAHIPLPGPENYGQVASFGKLDLN